MDAWERMYRDEEEALSFFLSQEFRGVVTMSLSQDTGAWLRAVSRTFARRVVKEAAMDIHYVPVVLCEDEPIHTDERPFCSDERCPCHDTATNDELFAEYIERPIHDGLLTVSEGLRLYWGEQV